MFLLKLVAHVAGMLVLLASISWFELGPGASAFAGLVVAVWFVVVLARCVRHLTRRGKESARV